MVPVARTVTPPVSQEVNVSAALNVPVTSLTLTEVFPAAFNPVAPLSAYKARFAKYVKQFNHSILVPLVTVNASTPGVIKVTL